MSDEQLDKGETGDAIWDAAQYQLALTGHSLHALSQACPPPPDAEYQLAMLHVLSHAYMFHPPPPWPY